ncbi:MAG: translation elongation factor Ts [Anaerolineales bacterium]|nr:translation elongation factor Ts [Anaerolineales bacterium]QYK50876.1 MAG: translation elongation factor Ts [Anaerolineales bacterium]
MTEITTELIKELRQATGAGILDCRAALEEAKGDFDKAVDVLRQKGLSKAAKRADREVLNGVVELYSHGDGRVGVMVEVNCETDFVARSEAFRTLAHEIALQIAASSPQWLTEEEVDPAAIEREKEVAINTAKESGKPEASWDKISEGRVQKFLDENVLLRQGYIRDDSKTIKDMISEGVVATGENIVIRRFARWELGGK